MDYVQVDGSRGEGGGQILRTAVAFSAIQARPVRIDRIRAGRDVPGLKRQHVSALEVLAKVFGGELEGASEGSSVVTFVPGKQQLQRLSLDMGTAASITLVLQAVVPAVALTRSHLDLELVGGTDVPWSPTYDYFEKVVRAAYESVGIDFTLAVHRRGYYPRGGGRVTASIGPSAGLRPLDLTEKRDVREVTLLSRCGRLPRHVAERQLESATADLESAGFAVASTEPAEEQSDSPGSSLLACHLSPSRFIGADGIGAKGKPAEEVGRETASRFTAAARSGGCLDSNLADMVIPLLSLAPGRSRILVPAVTPHLVSGLELASQFTGCSWSVGQGEGVKTVTVSPSRDR
ncbi:MAG TPA: RNA 3'-terminal phosphate cyclase [Nitrososphaerales archaeon]|nr:RNA 3'-terminal phosphate cyclase [Nitrososphaerales archaeon]